VRGAVEFQASVCARECRVPSVRAASASECSACIYVRETVGIG
jgi:hypothetical protein